jgi:hypothetical protein
MRWAVPRSREIHLPEYASAAAAMLFFRFLFRLSGFVNVVLILWTRPNVLLFGSNGELAAGDPRREREQGRVQFTSRYPDSTKSEESRI